MKFQSVLLIPILGLLGLLVLTTSITAQENPWNKKKAAVSLTYDDAVDLHLKNVVPILDSLDFKATFYLTGSFPGFKSNIEAWKEVGEKGHELGNHTLFHPCDSSPAGREWVEKENDLSTYSVQRMASEIQMTNILLQSLDGKTKRSFAYPCGDMKAGGSSYVESIKNDFVAARGVESGIQKLEEIKPFDVKSFMIHGQTGEELIDLVEQALEKNALVVFLFHGVGGGHDLNVSQKAHEELLHYLKKHEQDIWTGPFVEIMEYVRTQQN